MKGVLVDSNVILDIFLNDPTWADWSEATLEKYSQHTTLYINSIIYFSKCKINMSLKIIDYCMG